MTNKVNVENARGMINSLDTGIAQLLRERRELSQSLQALRVEAGESRVDLAREKQVRASYTAILGAEGNQIAEFVLEFCRGKAPRRACVEAKVG